MSALKVKGLTKLGRYGDGDGLWLQVRDAERRSWLFRYTAAGKQRQMGLGPYPDVSLAEAREAAARQRQSLRGGADPIDQRRHQRTAAQSSAAAITFRYAAEHYLAAHEATWRNAKHQYQWRATLGLASAQLGDLPVGVIATGDVLRVLEPIWRSKTETASRLRGRIEAVLDFATAHGWRTGENPARWRRHLANLLPAPSKIARVTHHAALPWQEIGTFMAALRSVDGVSARALEFTILTATRTGETIGARWMEVDTNTAVWTIPGSRMKAGAEHRVPLSSAAMDVLKTMAPLRDDRSGGWVFPGYRPGRSLSNMAMIMQLRRMGHGDLTVHGFRSSFRDWCAEATNYRREIAEKALAHTLGDETERAYQRGDMLERRRHLMEAWAEACAVLTQPAHSAGARWVAEHPDNGCAT